MRNKEKIFWTVAFLVAGVAGCRDAEINEKPTPIPPTHPPIPEFEPTRTPIPEFTATSNPNQPISTPLTYSTEYESPIPIESTVLQERTRVPATNVITVPSTSTPSFEPGLLYPHMNFPDTFPDAVVDLELIILHASQEHEVDPKLIASVIASESRGEVSTSIDGAQGYMQVMPVHFDEGENPEDPATNINRGTELLAGQLAVTGGNIEAALAGYNAGPAARVWILAPESEYQERKNRFIEIFATYLIEERGYDNDRAYSEAEHKAWEVEEYIRRVLNWYNQFE